MRLSRNKSDTKSGEYSLLGTFPAKPADFQPQHPDLKAALPGHLFFELVERGTRVFHNGPAAEAGHMAVVAIRLGFVIVLLTLEVHQIELVDQAAILEQGDRAINGGAVDIGILLPGAIEEHGCVQVTA